MCEQGKYIGDMYYVVFFFYGMGFFMFLLVRDYNVDEE